MRRGAAIFLAAALVAPLPGAAQEDTTILPQIEVTPLGDVPEAPPPEEVATAEKGALLRGLDKISGKIVDFELQPGQTKQLARILVTLSECRYPVDNAAGDAYAFVTVRNVGEDAPVFQGWMIASSPALDALDHPRYDVWVLRCITP